MNLGWEIAANVLNAVSIVLAGRNSAHTWWTGILGCLAFAWVFFVARLYADVTLQFFFVGASVLGYLRWRANGTAPELPVQRVARGRLVAMTTLALVVAALYGALLRYFTNAFAPFVDSVVLSFSVLGQLLLVSRRVESWWCWLLVNTLSVPLYLTRGLHLTALLYAAFWVNAVVSLRHWQKLAMLPEAEV